MSNLVTAIDTLTSITSLIMRLEQARQAISADVELNQAGELSDDELEARVKANRYAALARMEAQE